MKTSTERRIYNSNLVWLNLVCLDAPIVAISWQWLFARTFAIPLKPANSVALFLTAWLIYLADRLGDSVSLPRGARKSARQEFCAQHHLLWICAIGLVALLDAGVIATRLEFRVLAAGVVIGTGALVYLVLNHRWSQLWRVLPVKEVTIGCLFAAGTTASLLPAFPLLTPSFVWSFALFACLCTLNCMCIARWECDLDLPQRRGSIATAWPRIANRVRFATLVLAGLAFGLAGVERNALILFACLGMSALALTALDTFGDYLLGDTRTACADLVLLTPLLVATSRAISHLSS